MCPIWNVEEDGEQWVGGGRLPLTTLRTIPLEGLLLQLTVSWRVSLHLAHVPLHCPKLEVSTDDIIKGHVHEISRSATIFTA